MKKAETKIVTPDPNPTTNPNTNPDPDPDPKPQPDVKNLVISPDSNRDPSVNTEGAETVAVINTAQLVKKDELEEKLATKQDKPEPTTGDENPPPEDSMFWFD